MTSAKGKTSGGNAKPASPYSQLEAPGASSTGLTGEQRRAIFLNKEAFRGNADIQKNISEFGCDLSLVEFPEWQRTKHVHRLHPYLGKFIPQLVELFLRRFFAPGQMILDPFAGSGTTLVEANVLAINAVGIELSPFNCGIVEAKTHRYDLDALTRDVADALERIELFSRQLADPGARSSRPYATDSEYLNTWLAPRSLQQILFYRSIMGDYGTQDVLRIILSRATRSARLIPHYDLARPKKPLKPDEEYYCVKHKRICRPINDALKFLRRYSRDTVQRIEEFSRLRTDAQVTILHGDARSAPLPDHTQLDGIFTSPPYVGIIDYHEQHRYAYELFPNLRRRDGQEIGPMSLGKSKKAKQAYQDDIAAVFRRLRPHLKPSAKILVVANDRHALYPAIGKAAGLRLVDTFHRPVSLRTQRDAHTYFESIFWFEPA